MALSEKAEWQAIYHELSQKYGQLMLPADVEKETAFSLKQLRDKFPEGWVGERRGLRMKTVSLAYQIAKMKY